MNDSGRAARVPKWVFCLCLVVSFVGIIDRDLWTPDEPRDAAISVEMSHTGDYVVPHLGGQPFVEKPPLYFAVAAQFVKAFGPFVDDIGAVRLSTAFWGIGVLLMGYFLTRRLFGRDVALPAVAVLATMEGFVENMHWIRVDAALAFFVVAALWGFGETYFGGRKWGCVAGGLFTAGAFLSKGAVGPLLVAIGWLGMVVPWFVNMRKAEKKDIFFSQHIIAFLCFLVPAMAWMIVFYNQGGPALWHEWFWENHFGRMSGTATALGHIRRGAVLYYGKTVLMYCLPWSLMIFVWGWEAVKGAIYSHRFGDRISRDAPSMRPTAAHIFVLVWAVGSIVILTLSATKRDLYLLPVLPAFAIMCAEAMIIELPAWCELMFRTWLLIVVAVLTVLAATPVLISGLGYLLPVIHRFAPSIPKTLPLDNKMGQFLCDFTPRHICAAVCVGLCVMLSDRRFQKGIGVLGRTVAVTALFWIGALLVAGRAGDTEKSMKDDFIAFGSRIPKGERPKVAGWNFDETTTASFYCYCDWTVPHVSDKKTFLQIVSGKDKQFREVIVTREPSLSNLITVPYRVILGGAPGDKLHRRDLYLISRP
jgi:4-amino-4-deoxy-L-arabinose transferase-like glycosyltransferase